MVSRYVYSSIGLASAFNPWTLNIMGPQNPLAHQMTGVLPEVLLQ